MPRRYGFSERALDRRLAAREQAVEAAERERIRSEIRLVVTPIICDWCGATPDANGVCECAPLFWDAE